MGIDYRTWVPGLHGLRDAILDTLGESDLEWGPGGLNPTWSALLARWWSTQRDYRQSMESLDLLWSPIDDGQSLVEIRQSFAREDALLGQLVDAFDDAELSAEVHRPDLSRSRRDQIQAYVQSELMLLAVATVYLRSMGRTVPPAVAAYVG